MQIIEAALKLFVEKGFALTSIQDILKEADISKGTFYNYFASKNECLMAILDYVKQQGDQKRRELEYGRDKREEKLLVEQLAIRMNMNRDHNLIALFEAASFSDDKVLLNFIKKMHIEEIEWISGRIAEVFTPETNKYALDHGALLLGMIHHLMQLWRLGTKKEIASEKVVQFALNRLKPMINDQLASKEVFFPVNWLATALNERSVSELNHVILSDLEDLEDQLVANGSSKKQIELVRFLREEISTEQPRVHLVESVLVSLADAVKDSKHEHDIRKITQVTWQLLCELREEK